MKKWMKRTFKAMLPLLIIALIATLVLAYFPFASVVDHDGISQSRAAELRRDFSEPHLEFETTDGEVLFLRKWEAESSENEESKPVILMLHSKCKLPQRVSRQPAAEAKGVTFDLRVSRL